MTPSAESILARCTRGLASSFCKLSGALPAALMFSVVSGAVMAQESASGEGFNGWWLFLGISTVLGSGLYLQSTRRRSG